MLEGTRRFERFRAVANQMLADTDTFVADAREALGAEQAATALAALRAQTLQGMTAALAAALDEESVIEVLAREVGGTPDIDEVVIGRAEGREWIRVQTLGASGDHGQARRVSRDAALPIPTVARTGEAIFFAAAGDALERFPAPAATRGTEPTGSWAVLPMRVGAAPETVLALRFDIPREFTPAERIFLLTLADQVAQALERVRLQQEQAHIAHVLQQSLLPAELPSVPGIEIAVRYTVRAVAMAGAGPAQALGRLNSAIRLQGFGTLFMTAAQVALTVEDGRVGVLACRAGHPHPLIIRASGEVEEIGATGRLLGVFDDPALTDVEAVMGPGDALAVFTDGLTEARQGKAIMGEEGLRDDVALVVVRVADGGPAGSDAS